MIPTMKLTWTITLLTLLQRFPTSLQASCFDTMCWSDHRTRNISCDHSAHHCRLTPSGNPVCAPGSVDIGVNCTTDNPYFRCHCDADVYGSAYCNCFTAVLFWGVVGGLLLLFVTVQTFLVCYCCRKRSRRVGSPEAADIAPRQGGEPGGVRVLPTEREPLLQEPPTYDQVVGVQPQYQATGPNAPPFINPPVNPYFQG